MAKLILTPEEERASTWFELPDDTVGKVCKNLGAKFLKSEEQFDMMATVACSNLLITAAQAYNAEEMENQYELPDGSKWAVIVKKI